tara:strand:- start:541 stop:1152 length:612 start_codon:yes stop_codon:yes gene_type:complete
MNTCLAYADDFYVKDTKTFLTNIEPSISFAKHTRNILQSIATIEGNDYQRVIETKADDSIESKLTKNKEQLLKYISNISMHVSDEWRKDLISKLDALLDPEDWDDEDEVVSLSSFELFLSWQIMNQATAHPSYGLSMSGHFVAAWLKNENQLVLEFLKKEEIKWSVTKYYNESTDPELATGLTSLNRLTSVLEAYAPEEWLIK